VGSDRGRVQHRLGVKGSPGEQALIYAKDVEASWEDDPVYGHQVAAFATTVEGIAFKAYLHPVNPNDPDEGSFDLNTAFPLVTGSRDD
jgi:hypothetical protein